jgi:phosphatidylethanolamine-binding protein (PEBP) family uncharacterized protein
MKKFQLSNFENDETCLSKNAQFPSDITIPKAPRGTKSVALVITDFSKVTPHGYHHGLFYNLNPNFQSIDLQNITNYILSNHAHKYSPPCPPRDSGIHAYHFEFYFLRSVITKKIKSKDELFHVIHDPNDLIEKITLIKKYQCPPNRNCVYQ